MRVGLALLLFPPLGLVALVLLALAIRALCRRVAALDACEEDSGAHDTSSEQKLIALSCKLSTFALIYGALNYATAGVVFGLVVLSGGLGCAALFTYEIRNFQNV